MKQLHDICMDKLSVNLYRVSQLIKEKGIQSLPQTLVSNLARLFDLTEFEV